MKIEEFFPVGFFKCEMEKKFINLNKICDGIINCEKGNDEIFCPEKIIQCPDICKCQFESEIYCELENHDYFHLDKLPKYGIIQRIELIKIKKNILKSYKSNNLIFLKLENCKIKDFSNHFFTPNLIYLNLTKNLLTSLTKIWKNETSNPNLLQIFDISYNPLQNFSFISKFQYLHELYASNTKVNFLDKKSIGLLKYLKILILKECFIKKIDKNLVSLKNVEKIDITKTTLPFAEINEFVSNLKKIEIFKSEYFSICCNLWKNVKTIKICSPSTSIFKTCSDLIGSKILKVIIWIFGILSVFQNLAAIFVYSRKTNLKISFFPLCLTFSDLGIGIYLVCLSIKDLEYSGNFFKYENIWIKSGFCTFLGLMMNFSLMNSSLSVVFISMQKYLAIKFPMNQLTSLNRILFILIFYVFLSLFLAILPYFLYEVKYFF